MPIRNICFRLPVDGLPRVVLETDYGFRGGRLLVDGRPLLALATRETLSRGGETRFLEKPLTVRLDEDTGDVELRFDGALVPREEHISVPTAREAWIHAVIALGASFFGFVAGYLYLEKAELHDDPWALKMAIHMAGWHLLLTLTLFPASVWGQRIGIRAVQLVSLVFFFIHAGIAIANTGEASTAIDGPWIPAFNALSGVLFAAAVAYGQRAHRAMDPDRALQRALAG